jgi:hypothetical protein
MFDPEITKRIEEITLLKKLISQKEKEVGKIILRILGLHYGDTVMVCGKRMVVKGVKDALSNTPCIICSDGVQDAKVYHIESLKRLEEVV